MTDTTISARQIRKALADYIVRHDMAPDILQAFVSTSTPTPDLTVKADEAIVAYLNAHSTPVYGKGARFFLPIARKFGEQGVGEPLLYSDGHRKGYPINGNFYNKVMDLKAKVENEATVSPQERALWEKISMQTSGTGSIKDLEPSAAHALLEDIADVLKLPKANIDDRGVRFRNGVDGVEQAVRGNGQEVMIIGGDMTPEKALLLQGKLNELTDGTGDPEMLTPKTVQAMVAYAAGKLGLVDLWDGEIGDVLRAVPVDGHSIASSGAIRQYAGYFVHKPEPGKELAVIRMKGGAQFMGDVVERQDYSTAPGFFVTLGVRKGKSQYRGLAEEAFCRDYVNRDNAACNAGILLNMDTVTLEVTPPAQLGTAASALHSSNTPFKSGGRGR